MGLDAYVETRHPTKFGEENQVKQELWYGRKDWHIQNWMADQYHSIYPDNGTGFNCQDLDLTQGILNRLRADFVAGTLLGEEGCFKGINELKQKAVLDLLAAAEQAILDGEFPIYIARY